MARLVLIEKLRNKTSDTPTLNSLGKLSENAIRSREENEIKLDGTTLSNKQFGYRKSSSMVDAMKLFQQTALKEINPGDYGRPVLDCHRLKKMPFNGEVSQKSYKLQKLVYTPKENANRSEWSLFYRNHISLQVITGMGPADLQAKERGEIIQQRKKAVKKLGE